MSFSIRNQCFETNSSSSHSVTISADEMLDLSFDRASLRRGVISITPRARGYGSEQFRYITPEGKLAYLLVMAAGGEVDVDQKVFDEQEIDVMPILLLDPDCGPQLRQLVAYIREEHRCDLQFVMDFDSASSIYLNNQPFNLSDLMADREKLGRLLFSSKSWIDTRRDEDAFHFERYLQSDMGDVFASPHAYVSRSLPSRFELSYEGENATYSDNVGLDVKGYLRPASAWEETTNSYVFLRSQTANAHIVGFQVGKDDEPRVDLEPESECPFADAFHNLLHYFYLRNTNDRASGFGFKLTVEPGIKAHVRGRRQMKDFWPHFAAHTGLKITVACDEETRLDVRRYFQAAIGQKLS